MQAPGGNKPVANACKNAVGGGFDCILHSVPGLSAPAGACAPGGLGFGHDDVIQAKVRLAEGVNQRQATVEGEVRRELPLRESKGGIKGVTAGAIHKVCFHGS